MLADNEGGRCDLLNAAFLDVIGVGWAQELPEARVIRAHRRGLSVTRLGVELCQVQVAPD